MAIVRQASRERWPIVEGELRPAFRKLQAGAEGIDLPPESYNLFLFFGEVKLCGDLRASIDNW
jgi:hypothetical protein